MTRLHKQHLAVYVLCCKCAFLPFFRYYYYYYYYYHHHHQEKDNNYSL